MISCNELAALYHDDTEFAVVDPRAPAVYARGHLLAANNMPFSRLEIDAQRLLPCRSVLVVITGDTPAETRRCSEILGTLGYRNLKSLEGGLSAWVLSGRVLFSGSNVLSKAFGEYVEHHCRTPSLGASELHDWQNRQRRFLLLDGRTLEEHQNYCIPGAVHCANGDLPRAVAGLSLDEEMPVVVHCAGRTRSIIGAQTLRDNGVKNPVYALRNGTLDWQFAGLELEHGANRSYALPDPAKCRETTARLEQRAQAAGIERVDPGTIALWRSDPERTLYLFDVRAWKEFRSGTLSGAVNAPGGQLVQATDKYIGVRNARIVLLDDDNLRARSTALWLQHMGLRHIFTCTPDPADLAAAITGDPPWPEPSLDPGAFSSRIKGNDVMAIDLRGSASYVEGHVPGSAWLSRQAPDYFETLPRDKKFALITDMPSMAALVCKEMHTHGLDVVTLAGGMQSWLDQGYLTTDKNPKFLCDPDDFVPDPDYFQDPVIAAREGKRYLRWEIELLELTTGDPAARFDISY